jgi:DNA-binding GntR family transcriptional regulator
MNISNEMRQDRSLSKIERAKSLDEKAYLRIKKAIMDCTFLPGEFLAELQLARDLGISKTPIRKAMARLEQEGFLVNIPFKGYYVADITVEDIIELYELREFLEAPLVRRTAPLFTQAELDEMESVVQAAEEALEQGNYADYFALNRKFHHTFAYKYGNRRILNVLINLDEHVQRVLSYLHQKGLGHLLGGGADHLAIIAAIREGDFESAQRLMRNHLAAFREAIDASGQTFPAV